MSCSLPLCTICTCGEQFALLKLYRLSFSESQVGVKVIDFLVELILELKTGSLVHCGYAQDSFQYS